MSMQARELETFFRKHGSPEDTKLAAGLAVKAKAIEDKFPTPRIEIPSGIRTLEFVAPQALTKEDFKREFQQENEHNIEVTPLAWKLTDKFELTSQAPKLTLAFPTGRDLGITRTAPYEVFLDAVVQSPYFTDLHPELSLYMRRYYNQPLNEVVWLAMRPMIPDGDVLPRVFALGHDSRRRWLDTYWAGPVPLWDPDSQFVCGVRK